MFCVLNTSHPEGQNGNWNNLSFYIDNILVDMRDEDGPMLDESIPTVEKFNETAIRLHVKKSQVSNRDFYSVTCKLNYVTGICARHVYVGCEF